jgi:hypothetical protein
LYQVLGRQHSFFKFKGIILQIATIGFNGKRKMWQP